MRRFFKSIVSKNSTEESYIIEDKEGDKSTEEGNAIVPISQPDVERGAVGGRPDSGRYSLSWLPSIPSTAFIGAPRASAPTESEVANVQRITFELDISATLLVEKRANSSKMILASLMNWPNAYVGDYHKRKLWMTLAIVAAIQMEHQRDTGNKSFYAIKVKEGLSILVKSVHNLEVGHKESWGQTMDLTVNGSSAFWSFAATVTPTLIPYPMRRSSPELRGILSSLWIETDETDGKLIIIV
uniref:ORF3 protein n=1 Tax=Moussa virus TaxID=698672 RepID=D2E9Y0_9RHAB|nr:ORF3 protein [Moussa virus]